MSNSSTGDQPDIIWVNEYPNSSGVTHPSRAIAEANVGPDGTTAAYQRLEDGIDPETCEQVERWATYSHHGQFWFENETEEDAQARAVLYDSFNVGWHNVKMTGWKPKPQPEPESSFMDKRRIEPSEQEAWEVIAEWATTADVRPDVVVECLRDALSDGPVAMAEALDEQGELPGDVVCVKVEADE